jgi:hypothetical protein
VVPPERTGLEVDPEHGTEPDSRVDCRKACSLTPRPRILGMIAMRARRRRPVNRVRGAMGVKLCYV